MNDEVLRSLGRNYSVSRIYEDLEVIQGAGFENLSVDMMMALPAAPGRLDPRCKGGNGFVAGTFPITI